MAKSDMSISNLWPQLEFVCGQQHDGAPCNHALVAEIKMNKVLYICPCCGASTNYYDIEKFVDKVTAVIIEDAEDGVMTNLTNFKHKMVSRYDSKQHVFQVLEHTNSKMKVSIRNER